MRELTAHRRGSLLIALDEVAAVGENPGCNLLRHVFLDPEGREYYLDWEEIAEGAVAGLRASAGPAPAWAW